MTKYKEYVAKMLDANPDLFNSFQEIHDKYSLDQDRWQVKFNQIGEKIMEVVREYEDRLCFHSEGSGYAKYSGNLAEKFQEEVRKLFPMIDRVGLKIEKPKNPSFTIKKINLLSKAHEN